MKSITILLLCLVATQAAIKDHLVTDLDKETGYTKPWYSGYLDVSTSKNTMKAHYFFFPSQNKPEKDPVLLWLNGGPGCSSLLGASQENGPWIFKEDSTEIELNEFSWNLKANVIYLESPPGVGYSTTTDYKWDDASTAKINLEALKEFFNQYDEYRNLPFFIAGESYAGIYIPTLADDILQYNKNAKKADQINLQGILVGNGCTDPLECSLTTLVDPFGYDMFASQGFLTPQQQDDYFEACGSIQNPDAKRLNSLNCFFTAQGQLGVVSPGVNIYNLIGTCYHQNIPNNSGQNTWRQELFDKYYHLLKENPHYSELAGETHEEVLERRLLQSSNADGDLPPCTDGIGPQTFFNDNKVKKALHVDTDIHWGMCNMKVTIQYSRSKTGTYYLYPDLIAAGLRVWIYSGDTDGAVPTSGTLYWIEKLNKEQNYQTVTPWRAWYTEGVQYGYQAGNRQNAGQFWQTDGLTLVTFKGCGHMVPQDNHVGGYDLVTAFFAGEVLPPY